MNTLGGFASYLNKIDEVLALYIYFKTLHNKSYCYQLLLLCKVQLDLFI